MPGSVAQLVFGVREMSAVLRCHGLRAGVQVSRAGVIAEPGPGLEHVVERRRRQRLHIRPARQEFRVIRPDRLHGGLLQHDLRQPHVVRVGPLARRGTPRQMAAMPVVPGEQRRGIGRLVHMRRLALLSDRCPCYPHHASDVTEPNAVNKPRPIRKLAELTSEFLADAFKKQGFAATELVTRWKDIVGADIAAHAEPVKLQWPREVNGEPAEPATLVLRVEGPVSIEIQHQSAVILERINRFFGWQAVGRITLRQAPLSRPKAKAAPPKIDAAEAARVEATLTGVTDDGLRAALGRLGAAVKGR